MALGRLSIKTAEVGKAVGHAEYIMRKGKFEKQTKKAHELRFSESGNLPNFAKNDVLNFWIASDKYERVNGTAYREMELALPRELTEQQRINLVREWVKQELGNLHCYTWTLHDSKSLDGGLNPHVHLMFSERRNDGIEREAEQYFKRYNSKSPEKGGVRKGYGVNAGKTLSYTERKQELKDTRNRWEEMVNKHLELAGHEERISMKSYQDRDMDIEPEKKQLPSQWRKNEVKKSILEQRQNKIEELDLQRLQVEKEALIPNAQRQIIEIEKQQQKQTNIYALINDTFANAQEELSKLSAYSADIFSAKKELVSESQKTSKNNSSDIWQKVEEKSKQLEAKMQNLDIKLSGELEQERVIKTVNNLKPKTQENPLQKPTSNNIKTPEQVKQLWMEREEKAGLTPKFNKNRNKSKEHDDFEM